MYNRDKMIAPGGPFNNLGLNNLSDDELQQRLLDLTMAVSDAQASVQACLAEQANREFIRAEKTKRLTE